MPFLRSLEDVDRKSIFLSHSSKDRTAVEGSVLPVLDDAGLSPWYSASDIHSAHDWEVAIRSNLIRCQWFAVVLTPQSIKSDWVKAEVNWAMDNRPGRILPILLQPCEPFELHLRL
ncbi:MAG: toll/interleukin-1 receptor domain-containing protein, partial [Verrucomicrobiota bacterium]